MVETAGDDGQARLSPNRRWLAYSSDESGQSEVYVRPFDRPGETIAISNNGGAQPRWAADGGTLFFLSNSHVVTAVSVETANDQLRVGTTRGLFSLNVPFSNPLFGSDYLPTKDGRFIVNSIVGERSSQELTVQVNWASALTP